MPKCQQPSSTLRNATMFDFTQGHAGQRVSNVSDLHNAVGSAPATALEDGAQRSTILWDGCCSQHKAFMRV